MEKRKKEKRIKRLKNTRRPKRSPSLLVDHPGKKRNLMLYMV